MDTLKKHREKAEIITSTILDLLGDFTPAEAYGILESVKMLLLKKVEKVTNDMLRENKVQTRIGVVEGRNPAELFKNLMEQIKNETDKAGQKTNH